MSDIDNSIACPNCGHQIDVNEILYHQVDERLKKQYNDDLAQERERFSEQLKTINSERAKLQEERAKLDEKVSSAIRDGLRDEKQKLRLAIKTDLEAERADEMKILREELAEKASQVKEFNKAKAELERVKREKQELRDAIEAETEKKLNAQIEIERDRMRKAEDERSQLKLAEREKIIEQLNDQLKEAQRKAQQGSTQLQGEVQELALEQWLAQEFPLDTIEEVKKGARGADCLQTVNSRSRTGCGTIYYESKRTKGFQPSWIEKFKQDIRERNADVGVLVTATMPSDMPRLGIRDGVWICSFDEFKSLSLILRESLIRLDTAVTAQENKGDKMGMLYDFLTGNEFRMQVEAIVDGFTQMKADLEAEKRSMAAIWKKREKQIDKVLLNTTHMYGSVKGIAGSAVQSVALLELSADEPDIDP